MAKTKDKVADTADSVRPFVERALRDEKLRDDVQSAFATARKLYDELTGTKDMQKAATKVARNKKLQRELREAVDDLRNAAERLQGKTAKPKRRGRRLLLLVIAAAALFNPFTGPETRRKLKDLVTGGSDEFGSSNGG
jgi:gas vesicle protein